MKTRLPWRALLVAACLSAPSLWAAQPVAPENHRISVQVLDPNAAPLNTWQVKLQVTYRPLVEGGPNTTETTKTRANCSSPSRFGGSIFPSFHRCELTLDRMVYRVLPATQISAADPRTLNLDVAPMIEDQGGTFRIDSLALEYMTCAKGCEEQRLNISLTCFPDDVEHGDVLARGLVLNYSRGAKAAPEMAVCGLNAGKEVQWANQATAMARVRGHFGEDQQMVSQDLLSSFSGIPTADHHWLWNPARGVGLFDRSCTLPDDQSFDNSRYMATLPTTVGWPYHHEVEVDVTSKPSGEVCSIWLTGTDDETYLRYFYEYTDGTLVKVYTSGEPDKVSRVLRWVNGTPWEYERRQMPDSVAGRDNILYWHRTAAEQWPARMDYTPDFNEFAALNDLAQQLVSRFPAKPQ